MSVNVFTVDEERRLAHRDELKRKLAEQQVMRERITELEKVVAKLDADSDAAASEHQETAGKLQSELDALDEEHVTAILAGKSAPAKSLKRRTEILESLTELNRDLESRCEANKRSAKPIRREINKLRLDLAQGAAIASKLANICSPETRRERLWNGLRMRMADAMLNEAERVAGVITKNIAIAKDNIRRRIPAQDDLTVANTKLADWQHVISECKSELARIRENDHAIQAKAISE